MERKLKIRNLLFLIYIVILIPSCATAPKTARYFNEDMIAKPTAEESILVIYRKMTPPVAYKIKVFLNDEELLDVPNETFTWVKVKPGIYKIRTKWPTFAFMPGKKVEIEAEEGNYYFVELGGSFHVVGAIGYSTSNIEQRSYEDSVSILKHCCRYVPTN